MAAEPLQGERFRSDATDQEIQACYDLLASGHSLSEILDALRELGPLNKSQSDLIDAPADRKISHVAGELTAPKIGEPVQGSRSIVPLSVGPSRQRFRDEKKSRPIAAVLFWMIPAISLTLAGIAGRLLINAGLVRNSETVALGAESVPPMPATIEVGRAKPERTEGASAGELAVTASPIKPGTQALGSAPGNNRDRGPLIDKRTQERPAATTLRPPVSRPGSAPRGQTQTYSSYPKEWGLPRRLTDGF
jgi:hypothetical protein